MEKIGMSFEGINRKGFLAKGEHQDRKMYSTLKDEFSSLHNPKIENVNAL
jgi:[ribosomal protein S5]-alanine N-acetyltransferase